jgi:hypothetical protein
MKTPMQELIEIIKKRQEDDEAMPFMYNDKIIALAESMLEKEEYTMGLLLNFILKRYSIDLDINLRGYCFINANGEEVTISEILEHFYN